MKKLLVLLLGIFIMLNSFAQYSDTTVVQRKHEFGIQAGSTTGVGFSFRYWPNKFGLQFTMLPVKTDQETYFNVGLTGLYSFYSSRNTRFFGYLGNNYVVDNYTTSNYDYQSGKTINTGPSNNKKYNIGFGPGFGFGSRVRFNLMVGYGFYDIFGKFEIYPAGEIGLYFRY